MHLDESHSKPPKSESESSKHWRWGGGRGQGGDPGFYLKGCSQDVPWSQMPALHKHPNVVFTPCMPVWCPSAFPPEKDLKKVNSGGVWVGTGSQG